MLRAGMAFLEGMLDLVPTARVAHIGIYREPETFVAVEYFFKAPADLGERLVIVVDPMLATANTAVAAIDRLKERGANNIRFVCLLAAPEGFERLRGTSRRADLDRRHRQRARRARLHSAGTRRRGRSRIRHKVTDLAPTGHRDNCSAILALKARTLADVVSASANFP